MKEIYERKWEKGKSICVPYIHMYKNLHQIKD